MGEATIPCTIDGSAQTFSSPAISTTGTHLLGTVSRTVNHASDGSKSLAISAVFQIRATLSGTYYGTITASANITVGYRHPPCLQRICCEYDDGVCRYDFDQPCFFRFYAYADVFLWKYQRDNCNQDKRQLLYHGRRRFHWPARSRMRPAVPARSPVRLITGIRTSVPRPAH